MNVLGIETTCDETACAIVANGKLILSEKVASQEDIHNTYGGVFPELACRRHFEVLLPLVKEVLQESNLTSHDIDLISVARGPGLIGALLIGLSGAKSLAFSWKKPFVGVNHVEAHLYAAMMECDHPVFPALGVVLSGGHTFMVKIQHLGQYEMIGTTVDDALGEAFDKVAQLLDLPYPGGPQIEKLALLGDPHKYRFKAGVVKGKPWNFSFSGLKTNVLYSIKGQNGDRMSPTLLPEGEKAHIAAAFQEAALQDAVKKMTEAVRHFGCKMVFLGGGVTQNKRLRTLVNASLDHVFFPKPCLSLDNAVMIAGLGYHQFLRQNQVSDPLDLDPLPRIPLPSVN